MTYDPNSSGALSYLEAASELADRGATPVTASDNPSTPITTPPQQTREATPP